MKIIFLIGNRTPMDLLLLSEFLKLSPPGEVMVGAERKTVLKWNNILKGWKSFRRSGPGFVGFNIFLNLGISRILMFSGGMAVPPLGELSRKYGFKFFYFEDVNSPDSLSIIREFNPDVILNHAPQRILMPLIRIPRLGIVNVHPALLPEYQGMGSCFWPLIDNVPFHGATLHYIDSEELDNGPIISSGRFLIEEKDSVWSLHVKSRTVAARLLFSLSKRLFEGEKVEALPQADGKYHKLPEKKYLRQMRAGKHGYLRVPDDRFMLSRNNMGRFDLLDKTTAWQWK